MRRWFVILCVLQGLSGCAMHLPGSAHAPSASGPAADAIAVTPLDDPAATTASGAPAAPTLAPPPRPEAAGAPQQWQEVAAPPPPEVPVAVKSTGQIACDKLGGQFAAVGGTGARTCVKPTRDGGKACRKEGDCSGQCLARSGTCAPVAPLLGCNDVLQADGRRVTLCLD